MNCLSYSNLVDCYTGTDCKILVAGSFDHKVVDNTDDQFDAKSAGKVRFQQELKYLSEYPNYQGEIMKNAFATTQTYQYISRTMSHIQQLTTYLVLHVNQLRSLLHISCTTRISSPVETLHEIDWEVVLLSTKIIHA